MERAKFVIVGLGNIGLPLIRMLSREFRLTCIDVNPDTLEMAKKLRGDAATVIQGDATSRLVLEEAGVAEADTVVITPTTEKINIEVARVVQEHFQVPRVISIGITQKGIEELERLGVEVESIFAVSATGLRNKLEHKTKTVHGIGLGKNEILEVEVHPHSRLANKPLRILNPKNWRVGLIYRDGNIVVPRGDTPLKSKDKVVLLGDPKVVKTTAERLSFRFKDFPLEYGDAILGYLGGGEGKDFLGEILYLFTIFPLERAVLLVSPRGRSLLEELEGTVGREALNLEVVETTAGPAEAVAEALQKHIRNPAILVLAKEALTGSALLPAPGKRGKRLILDLFRRTACPVLLAAGTFPYEKVAVPCLDSNSCQLALETTFELSAALHYSVEALFVKPSRYIASEEDTDDFDRMKEMLSDLSLAYKSSIRSQELDGNPIRSIGRSLPGYNLLVAEIEEGAGKGALASFLQPDVTWQIVRRSPLSTLLLPPLEIAI